MDFKIKAKYCVGPEASKKGGGSWIQRKRPQTQIDDRKVHHGDGNEDTLNSLDASGMTLAADPDTSNPGKRQHHPTTGTVMGVGLAKVRPPMAMSHQTKLPRTHLEKREMRGGGQRKS